MESKLLLAILLVEIALVGALGAWYPSFARRGLLFGSYVGPEAAVGDEARALVRRWRLRIAGLTLVAMAAAVVTALAFPGSPVAPTVPISILSLAAFGFYLQAYRHARAIAGRNPPATAAAPLVAGTSKPVSRALPWATTAACTLVGVYAVAYCASRYGELPARIPTHFGITGAPDGWSARSFTSVMLAPLLALFFGASLGGLTFLIARAKRALRYPDRGESLAAQERFRSAMTVFLAGTAFLTTLLMSWLSVASVEVGLGTRERLGPMMFVFLGAFLVWVIGGVVVLAVRMGQGGSRLEGAAAAAPLTNGLADDRRWKIGLFYVNREDPSWFVEHRFGLGYTINFGNPVAVAVFVVWLLAIAAFLVWALAGIRPA